MKYKINTLTQTIPKIVGLSFYILAMPIIALMIIPTIFGLTFLSTFVTSVFLGFIVFLHLSVFDTKIDIFGTVELSNFNGKKFIITIFVLPLIIGNTLKAFNIDLNISDLYYFSQIVSDITQNIVKTNFSENKLLYDYLIIVSPMLPIILLSYFFIKVTIYWLFIGLKNYIILLYELSTMIQ
ncbi:MAG: hypothetical protein WC656_03115 [Sulfurimonas sp.]|jgi:hypothetical protein